MKNLTQSALIAGLGVLFAAAAPRAAAVTGTSDTDAFNLAEAFAPGDSTVVGNFVEFSNREQIGTFTDGDLTVGFSSGVVLSTGDLTKIGLSAISPLNTDYSGTAALDTQALLGQIPGIAPSMHDPVRLSLTVTPDIAANFVNFRVGYLTSEISPSDKFGFFINGVYSGLIIGSPIDQGHPWISTSVPAIGFDQAMYGGGNPLNPQSFIVSLAVTEPGSPFALDFVLADGFDGNTDTAVFLGEFSASETALGVVAIPEPSVVGMLAIFGLGALARRRRLVRKTA